MQDPEIIQKVKIVKAKDRTYIQGFWGNPKEKHLVVEITEKQTPKHRDLIDIIAKKISGGGMTKAMAKQMRADLINAESQKNADSVLMHAVVTWTCAKDAMDHGVLCKGPMQRMQWIMGSCARAPWRCWRSACFITLGTSCFIAKLELVCLLQNMCICMLGGSLQAWVGGCPPLPNHRRRPLRNQRRRHLWKGVRLLGKPLAQWLRKRDGRRRRRRMRRSNIQQERMRRHLWLSL
jgi:hypothetical protein